MQRWSQKSNRWRDVDWRAYNAGSFPLRLYRVTQLQQSLTMFDSDSAAAAAHSAVEPVSLVWADCTTLAEASSAAGVSPSKLGELFVAHDAASAPAAGTSAARGAGGAVHSTIVEVLNKAGEIYLCSRAAADGSFDQDP